MVKLLTPSLDYFESWAAAVSEFDGGHVDGAGLPDGSTPDRNTCEQLIERRRTHSDTSQPLPDGRVHGDYFWIADETDTVVGFISLRYELHDFLTKVGGNIGYAVCPSRRRQGFASQALAMVLDRARELGLDRVLITCDDDNLASARTIESVGGVLQDAIPRPDLGYGVVRRYWVDL
jgi:predicted acetyltransferase